MKRRHLLAIVVGLAIALGWGGGQYLNRTPPDVRQNHRPLIVAAAASLTDALNEIAPLYQRSHPQAQIRYNFASSGALQQQIEQGAPADVFISAAPRQMDALQQRNLILTNTRRNLLRNRLVLVVPQHSTGVTRFQDLTNARVRRVAIGDPRSVPAGQYAEQVLKNLGLWDRLQSKLVLANNVRQVLQFVAAGNAQAGLVYTTDAKTSNRVQVVQTAAQTLHDDIIYPIAVVQASRQQANAREFSQFLSSDAAKQIFRKYGFSPI